MFELLCNKIHNKMEKTLKSGNFEMREGGINTTITVYIVCTI